MPRVTDTIATVIATGLDVCTTSDTTACYFSTRNGIVVVKLPAFAFVASARAPRDHNRNPFPTFAPKGESLSQLEADAAAVPVGVKSLPSDARVQLPRLRHCRRKISQGKIDELRALWRDYIADARMSLHDVGRAADVSHKTVGRYFKGFAAEKGAPALRPNGKLVSPASNS